MASTVSDRPDAPEHGARRPLGAARRHLAYRELLVVFTRTELKVKYKNSILGFLWSMLNPALYLVVFYIVFQLILGSGIPNFPIFLLSGLLVWNLFSAGLAGPPLGGRRRRDRPEGRRSHGRSCRWPSVGAALVHFFLQGIVLVARAGRSSGTTSRSAYLPLLPVALLALLLFTAGGRRLLAAAINVSMRDIEHIVELALLAWFWLTPIVYPFMLVAEKRGVGPDRLQAQPDHVDRDHVPAHDLRAGAAATTRRRRRHAHPPAGRRPVVVPLAPRSS